MQCSNNLKQVGLALHNYHDTMKSFPPVGTTIWDTGTMEISWLYPILPYLEQTAVYEQMKKAPNAYHATLSKQVAPVFVCPSDGRNEFDYISPAAKHRTSNYNAVMGPGRDGRYTGSESLPYGYAATDGVIHMYGKTRIRSIRDGTSNTLMVGERITDLRLWSKGWFRDPGLAIFQGKNVIWPMNTNPSVLCYRHSAKPEGCPAESQSMGFNDIDFGSRHPGGAQFGFADGSVHFLSETINFTTYQDLATIDGGETITEWSP
jgi:prepilin-type processing-associated H-X9-DG protein